jgi:TolB protein
VGRNGILFILDVGDESTSRIDQFTEGEGIFLDWSPDSQKLAYVKNNQIILYQVSTHQVQRIEAANATDVQWFPSGSSFITLQMIQALVSFIGLRPTVPTNGKLLITRVGD